MPIKQIWVPTPIWVPAHILVAVTHLPNRPQYSWFDIASYLSKLVEHINGDEVDNTKDNLQWVENPGDKDFERMMMAPAYTKPPRPTLKREWNGL